MSFDYAKLLSWFKPTARSALVVAVASGLVLFLPDGAVAPLGLVGLRNDHRSVLGLVFVVAVCFIGVIPIAHATKWATAELSTNWSVGRHQKRLAHLSEDEKKVLRTYIAEGRKTQYLDINDGVAKGLEDQRVIYRAASLSAHFTAFAFNLQPWAWKYLNKHPEVIGLDPSAVGTGQKQASG